MAEVATGLAMNSIVQYPVLVASALLGASSKPSLAFVRFGTPLFPVVMMAHVFSTRPLSKL